MGVEIRPIEVLGCFFFFFLLKVIFGDVFGVRGNCSTSVFFLVLFVVWVGCGKLVRVK